MVKLVVAMSGKRKSGKDYLSKILETHLKQKGFCVGVTAISHSLKKEYATLNGINFEELLTDGPYKEIHRKDMIKWGEAQRETDSGVFCRAATSSCGDIEILIVTDCRRPSDIEFFLKNYNTRTVRVQSSVEDRKARGYQFVEGIDDSSSECALDNYKFHHYLENSSEKSIQSQVVILADKITDELLM